MQGTLLQALRQIYISLYDCNLQINQIKVTDEQSYPRYCWDTSAWKADIIEICDLL